MFKDKYRSGVGIMLFNKQGYIFTGRRFQSSSYWQMPQGGIDDGESPEQAALRELLEETGTNKVEIIIENKDWIYYDVPHNIVPAYWEMKYSGQKQKWFLMVFLGEDSNININYTSEQEFVEWRWQSMDTLVTNIVPFKKEAYTTIVEKFSPIIKAYDRRLTLPLNLFSK